MGKDRSRGWGDCSAHQTGNVVKLAKAGLSTGVMTKHTSQETWQKQASLLVQHISLEKLLDRQSQGCFSTGNMGQHASQETWSLWHCGCESGVCNVCHYDMNLNGLLINWLNLEI